MDLVHELIQRTQTQRKFREHAFAMKDIQDHYATNFSAGNFGNRQQFRFFILSKKMYNNYSNRLAIFI